MNPSASTTFEAPPIGGAPLNFALDLTERAQVTANFYVLWWHLYLNLAQAWRGTVHTIIVA